MGRLAGFSYQDVTKKLRKFGFVFHRQARGDHEIWINTVTRKKLTIPHHKEISEGTLRSLLSLAEIDVENFLEA